MRTVGQMLKEKRIAKGLSLQNVEAATKIRLKFLDAMESDEYTKLPSLAYAKGFVKNYSEFLGLKSADMLAFFRRQTKEVPKNSLLPKGMSDSLKQSHLRLTPSRFIILIGVFLFITFLLYFGLQYRRLQQPPSLTIDSPKDGLVTSERRVDVFGKTDSDATVTVNGTSVLVRGDGKFFDQLSLDLGVNKVTIVANSRFGKSVTIVREVGYQSQ
jgi:cytoskeletal protein RodZ